MVFKQLNIDLNRKALPNWMIRSAAVLEPLLWRLKTQQLAQQVLHADETPVAVIADDKQTSYMRVYCSGGNSPDPDSTLKNIVIYDYQPSRASACPKEYLNDYAGYFAD